MKKIIIAAALLMMSVVPTFADGQKSFLTNYQLSADGSTAVVASTVTFNTQDGPVVVDNTRKPRCVTKATRVPPAQADTGSSASQSKQR